MSEILSFQKAISYILIKNERSFSMKITIGDTEIPIKNNDMKLARAAVNEFVEVAKRGAIKSQSPSLYYTTLIMMYKKSATLLDALGPENLKHILTEANVDIPHS